MQLAQSVGNGNGRIDMAARASAADDYPIWLLVFNSYLVLKSIIKYFLG
jgi:hypothetical protein